MKKKNSLIDFDITYCKEIIETLGLSERMVAKEIGISYSLLVSCFNGNRTITLNTRKKLASFFGTDFWGDPLDPNFVTVEYNGKKYKIERKLFYQWVMDKPSRSEIV